MRVLILGCLLLAGCSHFKPAEQSIKKKNPYSLIQFRGIPKKIESSIDKELDKQRKKAEQSRMIMSLDSVKYNFEKAKEYKAYIEKDTLTKQAYLRVIKRKAHLFKKCYSNALYIKSGIEGELTMSWLISSRGIAKNARRIGFYSFPADNSEGKIIGGKIIEVKPKSAEEFLSNCISEALESLIFPEPPTGQIPDVRFTFRFYS